LRIKSKDLQLRDVFHINDDVRSSDTGTHLDEQVCSTDQSPTFIARIGKKA
jgi:hypothetical protein